MKLSRGLLWMMAFFFGGIFVCGQPMLASTVQVGGCLPNIKNYSSITAAVGAVAAGSVVKVCPGTYAEQFIINTPLTLQGVKSGNSDRAVITASGANLSSNVDSIFGDPVAAQVLVLSGPVNISNITLDGTGNNQNNLVDIVGIFYASGSSGTVDGVTARLQSGNLRGYGIWAENGNATSGSVTIQNCDIHDVDAWGIKVGSNQSPPTLTATIKGNMITGSGGVNDSAAGNITNNVLAVGAIGIYAGITASNSVLNNTISITNPPGILGIILGSFGGIIKYNSVFNLGDFELSTVAIDVHNSSSATVEFNTIKDADIGVWASCQSSPLISGNTIWDAFFGVEGVFSAQATMNKYHNVDNILLGGC
ncbi:MAG TPA: right-handed parallel beta-helix repeat-containing protein [Terriglobales bacterium]